MSSSLLLKIFAFLSLAATGTAVGLWYTTGAPPPPWMLQVSLAFFVAALVTGLIGAETRPRLDAALSRGPLRADRRHRAGVGYYRHTGAFSVRRR